MKHLLHLCIVLTIWLTALQQASLANPLFSTGKGPLQPEEAFRYEVLSDEQSGLVIQWRVEPGYYLYRDHFLAKDQQGNQLEILSPPGQFKNDLNFGDVEIFPWDVALTLPKAKGDVTLEWQGCQDQGICYVPQKTVIKVEAKGEANAIHSTLPDLYGSISRLSHQGGTLWVLLGFLGLGLLLAFTPCTFPMLSILWTVLGGTQQQKSKSFLLASAYIAGMSLGFAGIGAVAGWTGASFQFALQSPVVLLAGAAVFLLLAAASLELFPLSLPQALGGKFARHSSPGSPMGAAAMGLMSVLLIGPCVTAPLAGALLYIAQTGDTWLGAAALGMLGLGQGLPLMVIALFGRKALPKSGAWLETSRVISAALMTGVAIWLASRVLPSGLGLTLWALLAFAVSAWAGSGAASLGFWRGFASRIALCIGLLQLFGAALGGNDPLRPLPALKAQSDRISSLAAQTVTSTAAFQAALARVEDGPIVVYFTADWCVICRGLERDVFTNSEVRAALKRVTFFKADITDYNDQGGALARELHVIGPPTVLFLPENHQERADLRLTGDFTAAQLLERLEALDHE